jgi:hypothetical protein
MMSDTFKKDYIPLEPKKHELVEKIKSYAAILEAMMKTVQSREMSIALTNLEQSIMWATKAIVNYEGAI